MPIDTRYLVSRSIKKGVTDVLQGLSTLNSKLQKEAHIYFHFKIAFAGLFYKNNSEKNLEEVWVCLLLVFGLVLFCCGFFCPTVSKPNNIPF